MKVYKASLFPAGWDEEELIGHFISEEKAWEGCFKSHSWYKIYRTCSRYEFHYKHYHIEEIEVNE